jgi:N-acetylglutamate synthase-like GNAT family acetyltransferase
MHIFKQPAKESVKCILSAVKFNTSHLTLGHLKHFFGTGTRGNLDGVVGLELFNAIGLLGSLAAISSRKRSGLESMLVAHAENYARNHGVKFLYLLTETTEDFFTHRGFRRIRRGEALSALMIRFSYSCI